MFASEYNESLLKATTMHQGVNSDRICLHVFIIALCIFTWNGIWPKESGFSEHHRLHVFTETSLIEVHS